MPEQQWDDWYGELAPDDDSLRQGDIFRSLVAYWFPEDLPVQAAGEDPSEGLRIEAEWRRMDLIVLTASCDLDARSAPHVLLAPVIEVNSANLKASPGKDLDRRMEALRSGLLPRHFMLSECPSLEFPRSFVTWDNLVFLPTPYIKGHCVESRLRLLPPFREKFGSWAGSRISAVGIERGSEIPEGPHRPYDHHVLEAVRILDAPQPRSGG